MNTCTLFLPATTDKSNLLQAFANHCQFGANFGHNWDAFWDSLNDWLEQQAMPCCLILDGSQIQQPDPASWQQCLGILDEARERWPNFSYRLENMPEQLL